MTQRPEILAPAGDESTIFEAIRAGADAVYFGLDSGFNARARAENLAVDRLSEVMYRLHELGKRGYLTLNTLVFDSELERLQVLLGRVAEAGVDAVIVQDLGLARWVKAYCPSLRLHASTQMTCTDRASIEVARGLGASRVTLARELPLSEVATLVQSCPIELEVFAHGALCVSYSGQCLTSEAIGGRSANRGACAQACRLPYQLLVDGVHRDLGDRVYLLSPKDLDSSSRMPEILATGVSAIKIEGRLKSTEYVRATTYLYRRAVDAALEQRELVVDSEREACHQAFSRGVCYGFLDGVNHQELIEGLTSDHIGVPVGTCLSVTRGATKTWIQVASDCSLRRGDGLLFAGKAGRDEFGGRIWALSVAGLEVEAADSSENVSVWLGPDREITDEYIGRRVYRTSAPRVVDRTASALSQLDFRAQLTARIEGSSGQSARLSFRTTDGRHVEVTLEGQVEIAKNRPLDEATAFDKLSRLGDTPYQLSALEFALEPGTTLPLSSLNRARRAAVEALAELARHRHETVDAGQWSNLLNWPIQSSPPPGLFVTCRNLEQARAALGAGATGVYLDFLTLLGVGPAVGQLREQYPLAAVGVALPRIRRSGDEKIDGYLRGLSPDAIVIRSLGSLYELETLGDERATDVGTAEAGSQNNGPLLIADFSLNLANSLSILEVMRRKIQVFTPSYDLDMAQLQALLDSPLAPYAEVVVHHPMPLFHTEHCAMAALLSTGRDSRDCGRPCERHAVSLKDRTGLVMPLEADVTCRNTVFHGKAQSGMESVPWLHQRGVGRFRIELVRESPGDTQTLVDGYRELMTGVCAPVQLRERFSAAGVASVKGSLRVVG